jgi:hypothetical protein
LLAERHISIAQYSIALELRALAPFKRAREKSVLLLLKSWNLTRFGSRHPLLQTLHHLQPPALCPDFPSAVNTYAPSNDCVAVRAARRPAPAAAIDLFLA